MSTRFTPTMEPEDELANLRAQREALAEELAKMRARHPENACADAFPALRAENNMLRGVIVKSGGSDPLAHADMRALLGELRHIHAHMHNGQAAQARAALGDLLRRFDRESQL